MHQFYIKLKTKSLLTMLSKTIKPKFKCWQHFAGSWHYLIHPSFFKIFRTLAAKWLFVGQLDNFICSATSMHDFFKDCFKIVNWILVELENEIFWFLVFGYRVFQKMFFFVSSNGNQLAFPTFSGLKPETWIPNLQIFFHQICFQLKSKYTKKNQK